MTNPAQIAASLRDRIEMLIQNEAYADAASIVIPKSTMDKIMAMIVRSKKENWR
jgi:hypothetical protein